MDHNGRMAKHCVQTLAQEQCLFGVVVGYEDKAYRWFHRKREIVSAKILACFNIIRSASGTRHDLPEMNLEAN